jgi:hypothetical protein
LPCATTRNRGTLSMLMSRLSGPPRDSNVMSSRPPYYVFVAVNNTSTSQPTSLRHPRIQYHYADDSPLSLLPEHPDEHVLLLDAGIASATATVHSISPELITTGLKIEDAPAASTLDATDGSRMYIVEAARDERSVFSPAALQYTHSTPLHDQRTATSAHGLEERKPATAILAQFKARYAVRTLIIMVSSSFTNAQQSNDPPCTPVPSGTIARTV